MRPNLGLKALLWAAFLALVTALITGNPMLASLLAPLLMLAALGLAMRPPRVTSIHRTGLPKMGWTGDEMEIELEVSIAGGVGMVSILESLPPEFELSGGSNYEVFWVWRSGTRVLRYSAIARKRGIYEIPKTQWKSWHGLYLRGEAAGQADNAMSVLIVPKPAALPYGKVTKDRSRLPPVGTTLTKVGLATSDFRDLRPYHFGDPLKAINWKATARRLSAGQSEPVTNQYESEGRRAVWILIDASPHMVVGDTLHNPLEICLQLSMGAARYFLRQGARVGLYPFGADSPIVYPDAGNRQLMRISGVIADVTPSDSEEGLIGAVQQIRASLVRDTPLCMVFTRLDLPDPEALKAGVRRLSIAGLRSRRRTAPVVVGVSGYRCVETSDWYERNAQSLLYLSTRPLVKALHAGGARVVEWQPAGEPGTYSGGVYSRRGSARWT